MKTLPTRLAVAAALVLSLAMGIALVGAGGEETLAPADDVVRSFEAPSPDGLFVEKSPCEPTGPGLCSLTSYDCFGGTCCCTYRTDCDAYQGGVVCFPAP